MTTELHDLLDTCIQDASREDEEILRKVLLGLNAQQLKGVGFISGFLQMERKIESDSCEITMPITPFTMNSIGIVHGGITATLIDSTMGSLSNHLAPEGKITVTTQLNINYLAPGMGDELTCIAKLEHKGSKTMVVSATVFRTDGKKVAHGTGSFFMIDKY